MFAVSAALLNASARVAPFGGPPTFFAAILPDARTVVAHAESDRAVLPRASPRDATDARARAHRGAAPPLPAAAAPARFPEHASRVVSSKLRALGNEGPSGTSRRDEDIAGLGGDFGARDATAGEIESNFNAKSIGEADTEHIVKIPDGIGEFTSLHLRSCVALSAGDAPCETRQALVFQKQVMDWKIREVDGAEVLRREFRTEDSTKAQEVINRFTSVAESEGQTIKSFIEGPGVRIELTSRAVKGLHVNDFVLAAKLDRVDVSDVVVKKKPQTFLI